MRLSPMAASHPLPLPLTPPEPELPEPPPVPAARVERGFKGERVVGWRRGWMGD